MTLAGQTPLPGVGFVGCSPDDSIFDLSATLGLTIEHDAVPEWIAINYVPFDGMTASRTASEEERHQQGVEMERLINLPGITHRINLRDQIPQSVVIEARKALRRVPRGAVPERLLHFYFIVREEDIQFSWALERSSGGPPIKYGGYVPVGLKAKGREWLESGKSQFIGPKS